VDYLQFLALKEFGIGLTLSLEFKVLLRAEQDCSGVSTVCRFLAAAPESMEEQANHNYDR